MKITERNNFCRVFELPNAYSSDFCFGGGIPTTFQMVDWFQPIPIEDVVSNNIEDWSTYVPLLQNWLNDKVYVKPNRQYLLITDFDESFIFRKNF